MSAAVPTLRVRPHVWPWPLDLTQYDRSAPLTPAEQQALATVVSTLDRGTANYSPQCLVVLHRLVQPVNDVCTVLAAPASIHPVLRHVVFRAMHDRGTSFWAWSAEEWWSAINVPATSHAGRARLYMVGLSYLLCSWMDLYQLRPFPVTQFATQVFGQVPFDTTLNRVLGMLTQWGYAAHWLQREFPRALATILLLNRSPALEDLTSEGLNRIQRQYPTPALARAILKLRRVLAEVGVLVLPPQHPIRTRKPPHKPNLLVDVPEPWLTVCERWRATSTLEPQTRKGTYETLLKVGRWLTHTHPDVVHPEQWTRVLAAQFVAAVDRWTVGEYTVGNIVKAQFGKPLAPGTKNSHYCAIRLFFRDLQEWHWIPTRFDPGRAFRTPRATKAKLVPHPRGIADDIWAKLLWAGLNLTDDDLPKSGRVDRRPKRDAVYPLTMVRALVLVWLFSGLRSDEIVRLRVGCIREQHRHVDPSDMDGGSERPLCWLDVPVNKTSQAFTKPVDPLLGDAVRAWEQERPLQPAMLDPKTGELVQYLFAYRGYAISRNVLNGFIIPMLCRKAGVPEQDARGRLTSHRARSTIASQLFNAKEPMSLFDLQAWLGHRSLNSTQHYAKISPTKLAHAYRNADYFARNVRTIEVLIDQTAVLNGDAANGLPWKYYDLGHGYCTYDFFDQCEHRMACAHCAFYRPKQAFLTLLEEKQRHLMHMRQDIPLTDLELATVEGDLAATEQLIAQLRDVPTPAGPTPRQLEELET
jgi:integrase